METYIYFIIMFFIIIVDAKVDASYIKQKDKFTITLETISFVIVYALSLFILYKDDVMPFYKWFIYCTITTALLRVSFYKLFLNKFLGKGAWYIEKDNTRWISKMDIRIVFIAMSIGWLSFHHKLFF